jgi:glucose/mannose-6-phosphate isomerase
MLDDLKFIHEKDAQDALGVAEKQWQQLEAPMNIPELSGKYANVVFSGMGGSALAASIATSWPGLNVPFEIVRGYDIPAYVGEDTLFIASSYSGNTEETLEAFNKAKELTKHLVCITTGGNLADSANEASAPAVILPQVGQPRYAALASLSALVQILVSAGVSAEPDAVEQLKNQAPVLKQAIAAWIPTVAAKDNQAKQLAQDLMGKSVVVYAGPKLFPAAYKWKISFNENAKNVAWCNQLPEFNHNEFLGWTSHPIDKPYGVIDLRSNLEHPQVQKRFGVSDRLLSGKRPAAMAVDAKGETLLQQLLWTIALGDFVSLYLALLNGLNPTPVDLIEKLKQALA